MSDSVARELGEKSAGLSTRASVALFALLAVGAGLAFDIIEFDPLVVAGLALLFVAVAAVSSAVEIVEAYEKEALTVFGEFRELLEPGIHFVPPFVSRAYPFDMRTQTIDVPRQEAITEDNSPVVADAVVYIKVMNAKRAFLQVDDYKRATSNLAQTTLRAVLGDMELDETLSKREKINRRIQRELEGPTDEWGVRVEAVEVREVNPSKDVKQAMEQQSSAERRRRAMILEAQGDAISTVLRAKSAESMGERAVIERGMETLEEIGKGESTKFVLPQELTSLVGRYGKHLQGSDAKENGHVLEGLEFDEETREMLGLDDIQEILGELENEEEIVDLEEMEEEAKKVKRGDTDADIQDPDELIDGEGGDEFNAPSSSDD